MQRIVIQAEDMTEEVLFEQFKTLVAYQKGARGGQKKVLLELIQDYVNRNKEYLARLEKLRGQK